MPLTGITFIFFFPPLHSNINKTLQSTKPHMLVSTKTGTVYSLLYCCTLSVFLSLCSTEQLVLATDRKQDCSHAIYGLSELAFLSFSPAFRQLWGFGQWRLTGAIRNDRVPPAREWKMFDATGSQVASSSSSNLFQTVISELTPLSGILV